MCWAPGARRAQCGVAFESLRPAWFRVFSLAPASVCPLLFYFIFFLFFCFWYAFLIADSIAWWVTWQPWTQTWIPRPFLDFTLLTSLRWVLFFVFWQSLAHSSRQSPYANCCISCFVLVPFRTKNTGSVCSATKASNTVSCILSALLRFGNTLPPASRNGGPLFQVCDLVSVVLPESISYVLIFIEIGKVFSLSNLHVLCSVQHSSFGGGQSLRRHRDTLQANAAETFCSWWIF